MSQKLDTTGQDERTIHDWYEKKKKIIQLLIDWRIEILYDLEIIGDLEYSFKSNNTYRPENIILEEILTIMNKNDND